MAESTTRRILARAVRGRLRELLNRPEKREEFERFRESWVRVPRNRKLYNDALASLLEEHGVELVGMHARAEHLPFLERALQHPSSDVRWSATVALRSVGRAAAPHAAKALEHADPVVRSGAAFALGSLGKWAAPRLAKALRHPKPEVRIAAAQALMSMNPQEAAPYAKDLIKYGLLHKDAFVRVEAASALGRLGPRTALRLAKVLEHKDPLVRMSALRALGEIGTKAPQVMVLKAARVLREDPNELVQRVAREAIVRMRPKLGVRPPREASTARREERT